MHEDDIDSSDYMTMSQLMTAADRQYAAALGAEHPEHAWILSDRDVWYPNPYYQGHPVPHPEEGD